MSKAGWSPILFALLASVPACPDTVTKANHLSVNGTVTGMSGGVIALVARFSSGTQTVSIQVGDVESIEFNDTTFNPGAPKKVPGLGPPLAEGRGSAQAGTPGEILLRGGNRQDCKLISIDQQTVHCSGPDGDHPRRITLRIVVGAR